MSKLLKQDDIPSFEDLYMNAVKETKLRKRVSKYTYQLLLEFY